MSVGGCTVAVVARTLAEKYPLFDDPETGRRYVVTADGEWAEVDMKTCNDIAERGMTELSPATRLLLSYLTS